MHRATAALGSSVFFLSAPGVIAGLVPWLMTRWEVRRASSHWLPLRVIGVALLAIGLIALIHSFVRFVKEGSGTPAPVAPTDRLVVGGLYRYVRNPMYVAVVATIVAQGLVLGQIRVLVYALAVWITVASFVRWYEEPVLARRFGAQYEAYRRSVPAWWPRRHPWHAA